MDLSNYPKSYIFPINIDKYPLNYLSQTCYCIVSFSNFSSITSSLTGLFQFYFDFHKTQFYFVHFLSNLDMAGYSFNL